MDTDAPHSSAIASTPSMRVRVTATPRLLATRSPSARIFSRGARNAASPNPSSAGKLATRSVCMLTPDKSPASQVRMACSVCSSRIRIEAVTAEANADSATPQRVIFIAVAPARPEEASSITRPNSSAAPPAAVRGRLTPHSPNEIPAAEQATTASVAPAFKPRICGSPSGLRIIVCSSSPATPSAAPVISAASRRVRRRLTMIRWSKLCGS